MALFAAKVVGGPMDGDTFRAQVAPRDGEQFALATGRTIHVYVFSWEAMRWVYSGAGTSICKESK